ncbi:MAG: hypothetical protein WCR58_06865 [Bacteroidales bacterium]|nr:hypothetical protein [Bacteroidales bacterium]MDD3702006.1 hypothetical protein [Bacteroidales bacterium]MDY0368996.1 hypothetical protein [Bacteroidales bacterium]
MIRRVYLLFFWLLTNALSARPKPNPYGLRVPNDPVRYQPEAAHHPDHEPVDVRIVRHHL